MKNGNTSIDVGFNSAEDLAAFDRLSKASRDLLNAAPFNISAQSARALTWRYDSDEAAPMIEEAVIQKCKRASRDMGPEYPHDLALMGWEKLPGAKTKRVRSRIRLTRIP